MKNILTLPLVYLVRRLAVVLTLVCVAYVVFYMFFKGKDNITVPMTTAAKASALVGPPPALDLKPYNALSRDIFSLNPDVSPSGIVENTPKGQLPDHLKVVGLVIGSPSQIVIEDSFANKTYFIYEGQGPQDGIKIVKVERNQMVINYQGQNISVPIEKS